MANRINLLDDVTANRIAAGEVVERPASAVKELVENAIDAGATEITILLEEAGKRRIEVVDNGIGMGSEDAVLALQRHATSKISSADDLFNIHTLGFRGEAVPSIASVSRFTLISKPADEEIGVQIDVDGGTIVSVEPKVCRDGTSIIVEDLFYNTPARLKFLKSNAAELGRILDVVGNLAIANPSIAFVVQENSHTRLRTAGTGDPLAALTAVWGREIARKLVPITQGGPTIQISGYICPPDLSRPGRSHELFYVNGRPIKSRLLGHALEDAVRNLTPDSRYPIAAIFVNIAPDMVDVNVHPAKTEVKFTHDASVHHAVSSSVKEALLKFGILPTIQFSTNSLEQTTEFQRQSATNQGSFFTQDFQALARAATELFRPISPVDTSPQSSTNSALPAISVDSELESLTPVDVQNNQEFSSEYKPFAEQLRGYRVLGQVKNTYIIAVTDEGIAVIDQHVAHERVLYERLTVKSTENGIPVQRLAVPFSLTLGPSEASLVSLRLADFASAGWELESFGKDAFLVRAVPAYSRKRGYEELLKDIVDELVYQSVSRRLIVQKDHVTITNACKMAVKAGDPLTIEEMQGLISQLADTVNPYVCPHGRPIVVTIPFLDIDKKFKRA